MKKIVYILSLIMFTQLTGCIIFNTVSYEVTINDDGTGTAVVTIQDINSDAVSKENLDSDANSILDYGLRSKEFVDEQKAEGKNITSRNLLVERDKLIAIVRYDFADVSKVEGMQFDDPYYYLTVSVEDSIVSTNGQVTKTAEYKRIVWDKSITTLRFKMYSEDTNKEELKSLAPYFLEEN